MQVSTQTDNYQKRKNGATEKSCILLKNWFKVLEL